MPEPCQEIYLDMNATTKVLPVAAQAALEAMEISFGNPSSSHITGLKAKHLMESTRQLAREVLGAGEATLVFNSGATEGIQTAILSALKEAKRKDLPKEKRILLYGSTEHKAVSEALKHWNHILELDAQLLAIPVDHRGILDLTFIKKHIKNALIVCTMIVNNETGVIQNISELEKVIRQPHSEVLWFVDCVQALGKIKINLSDTTIDYATFSGHKLYALKGIGLLYIRKGAPHTPIIIGGGQESGFRSGTENLPGMASLKAVYEIMVDEDNTTFESPETLASFRDKFVATLKKSFPDVVFNNDFECSVPTTINFSVPRFSSKEMMDLFDAASIRVSSGSACSSQAKRSYVLDAMGLEAWQSESAIRLSFGPAMTEELVNIACERLEEAGTALRQNCMILSDQVDDSEVFGIKGLIQLKQGNACSWLYCDEASRECVVIDPLPALAERIENMVHCRQLILKAVLDTHSHADHQSCRLELQQMLSEFVPKDLRLTDALGWPVQLKNKVSLSDGEKVPYLNLGTQVLAKILQPGHTQDSVAYLLGEALSHALTSSAVRYAFLGDTLLMGTLGRSDFKTSSTELMFESLQKIKNCLGEWTVICPSHDYHNYFVTTLEIECSQNELLAEVLEGKCDQSSFTVLKNKHDKQIIDHQNAEIMCGVYKACDSAVDVGEEINFDQLREWLDNNKQFALVDIREPYEHELHHQKKLGNKEVINIPLTRLAQFVSDRLRQGGDEPVVFMCRSGTRSKLASIALRRLGLQQVTHVMGGYALI